MIEEKTIPEQKIAVIKNKGTKDDIAVALSKLSGWVEEKYIETKGDYFMLYYTFPKEDDETIVFDIGVPISDNVSHSDDRKIEIADLVEHTVISYTHKGDHNKIRESYDKIINYCQENKYDIIGSPKEIFITNPFDIHIEEQITEIQIPVIKM